MKKLMTSNIILVLASILFMSSHTALASDADPKVVSSVDLNRYAGLWYEIAHAPNFFQRKCLRSTAEYVATSPATVSVKNTCYKENGVTSDIQGTAAVVDIAEPAKLKVRFNFFARGDYWIVDLEPNYQWAVVSGPAKKSLFILARQAPMDSSVLTSILTSLKEKGFNTEELIFDKY